MLATRPVGQHTSASLDLVLNWQPWCGEGLLPLHL